MQPVIDNGGYRKFRKKIGDKYHLGHDYNCNHGSIVKSITYGRIIFTGKINGFGAFKSSGGVIMIAHNDKFNKPFIALYGHLITGKHLLNDYVNEGQEIGKILKYEVKYKGKVEDWSHLHLNIYYNMYKLNEIKGNYGYDVNFNGTIEPIEYINTRT